MALFMDRHELSGATPTDLAAAHLADVSIQDKYGVKFLTYWFDYDRSAGFCLAEAPDQESIHAVHHDSHGQVPNEIIAVDEASVLRFMGGIPNHALGEPYVETAFRVILFTDIVDSTVLAREAGDASWKRTVTMHEDVVRSVLAGFAGREIQTAGDSFLVVFGSVEGAIRCGLALVGALNAIQLQIRVGIHSGEVVMSGDHIWGLAVHAAARIVARAGAGEVLVSGITRDLAEGATGLTFESRGRHRLKGLDREHDLFAAGSSAG